MISIPFINGYVRALRLDIERIETLKENKAALRSFAEYETDKHLEEVLKLNMR